ncbi:hypothetical protein K493DRAFT_322119 [Basidiobolus meristosporus CBS 931.73]|uniref:Uncharacterized protein n=1 Tax=Basidiobolus meristosporus CBS 931.73 TaxID=1314790 RepID=A0A1Y1VQ41_9FUNG|nr:hypothetical protein K493DRAFT_322119 [Basidiobolus meristosporus CBS 931.73]|eukprot:ORX63418.1 hypothetical protein K493DRAFT_322119 [Basidiobolus meristosporus CBS 931.73]
MFGVVLTAEQVAVIRTYVGRSWAGAIILSGFGIGAGYLLHKQTPEEKKKRELADSSSDTAK